MHDYWTKISGRRIRRRSALAIAGTAALGSAFLAACGGSDKTLTEVNSLIAAPIDRSGQAKQGGINKWFLPAEPSSLDVHTGLGPLNTPKNLVYGQLVNEKVSALKRPEFNELSPYLAESWEWSPDRLQVTMKLRPGVKWHNKQPVNGRLLDVEDIEYSWNRFAQKGSDRTSTANVANPNAPILSVKATDANTFVIKLKEPNVFVLPAFAFFTTGRPVIVPKETDSSFDIRRDMIGTGPFMLANYTPSSGFTFKRNTDYFEPGKPYLDQIDAPVISEYAQGMAQLRAGNLYTYDVRPEDILATKAAIPALNMYAVTPNLFSPSTTLRFGWQPAGASQFADERVRQAISLSYDRDLFIDTFSNVSKFREAGVPVETFWNTAMGPVSGWRLDPKGKDFGPNAKYFKYDPPEAKKLLSAAGFPNGIDITSRYPTMSGPDQRQIQVLEEMGRELGIRTTTKLVDYTTEYVPKLRDGLGQFEGWAYTGGNPSANDAVSLFVWRYYSKGGPGFLGHDVNGRGDGSGDPDVDSLIVRARGEFDVEKRRGLIYDLQRHLAKAMYCIPNPGSASGLELAWPALANNRVFEGDLRTQNISWWIDETKAPIAK